MVHPTPLQQQEGPSCLEVAEMLDAHLFLGRLPRVTATSPGLSGSQLLTSTFYSTCPNRTTEREM